MEMPAFIKHWFCMIVLSPLVGMGQLADDFSDGNFTVGPSWGGDVLVFRVNDDFQLQLDDDGAGDASLFIEVHPSGDMEWRCWARQSFSPSGNNFSRIYLLAETNIFPDMPDGVFIQLGEAGSADAVRLMIQANGDTSTLIRGAAGAIASSFACRIKVLLVNNTWSLFADYSGGEHFWEEGSCPGTLLPASGYLGVHCTYTSSNSTKFYFDDFYAGPQQHDTIAPQVLALIIGEPDQLQVLFSEFPAKQSAEMIINYDVNQGIGHPQSAWLNENDPALVNLIFPDNIPYGQLLQMSVRGVQDMSGNIMKDTMLVFSRYEAEKYDVVINEIMADPSPPVLLPEYEYLELYNTTSLPLDLSGWVMMVGAGEKPLTGARIDPEGYLIIGKDEAAQELGQLGPFFGLESFSLTNAGQELMLINDKGELISGLYYQDHWYGDDDKADGGWSLEQSNPFNPCLGPDNWQASVNSKGGSPGSKNSVYDELFIVPEIVGACVQDSVRIRVEFNQSMHPETGFMPQLFSLNNGAGPIEAMLPDDPYFTSFILYPGNPLYRGLIYELSLNGFIFNCVADSMFVSETKYIGVSENPAPSDLVINETLFNPFPGGSDYVEIYNRSKKVISLYGLSIASVRFNPPAPPDTSFAMVNESCRVLLPGEYALLCDHYGGVAKFYHCPETKNYLEVEGFPAYNNESGSILLLDKKGKLLDAFSYHEDMHYPLLNLVEGVSLERLHPNRPTYDPTNWHSASQLSGFGTPGYQNSQFSESGHEDGPITISPRVCSPGYDGLNDHIGIHFNFESPGYLANIMVFNAAGQLVRQLVNNEMLGTTGSFTWNGIDDANSKAPAGMYVILIELTDLRGKLIRYKKTGIVAP